MDKGGNIQLISDQTDSQSTSGNETENHGNERLRTLILHVDGEKDPTCQDLTDENGNLFLNEEDIPGVDEYLSFFLNENAVNSDRENPAEVENDAPLYVNGKSVVVRGDGRKFICSLCDKAFALKQHLEYHMLVHTGERAFICGVCKASFSLRHHLTQHMVTHEDESTVKKHTCAICGQTFLQGYNLTRHLRTHTGEKRFFCTICNRSFANSWSLQNHLLIHSNVKPFKCEICGNDFRKKYHLNRHLKVHSSEGSSLRSRRKSNTVLSEKGSLTCQDCDEIFSSQAKLRSHDCDYIATEYVERKAKKLKETSTVVDEEDDVDSYDSDDDIGDDIGDDSYDDIGDDSDDQDCESDDVGDDESDEDGDDSDDFAEGFVEVKVENDSD